MLRRMATETEDIGKALKTVIDNINCATQHRPKTLPSVEPRLVAVSKTKPVSAILAAYQHGQRHFGENYVQELEEKSRNLKILEQCKDIRWHFIGHLQRNKSGKLAVIPNLYMIETVDSQKLSQTLNNHWEKYKRSGKLEIMVQVNTSGEENKSGCHPSDVCEVVRFIREKCPCLHFAGIMTIGAVGYNPADGPNSDFMGLVQCRQELCRELHLSLKEVELSMGMSSDYEHAIALGSTNVRVGSCIFGARDSGPRPPQTEVQAPSGDKQSDTSEDCVSSLPRQPTGHEIQSSCSRNEETIFNSVEDPNETEHRELMDSVSKLNVDDNRWSQFD